MRIPGWHHERQAPGKHPDAAGESLAWRCAACGRYHLFEQMTVRPAACASCASSALFDAGPLVDHTDDGPQT